MSDPKTALSAGENTTNLIGAVYQDYVQDDAPCCVISVAGRKEPEFFNAETLDVYIASLQRAREAIFTTDKATSGEERPR